MAPTVFELLQEKDDRIDYDAVLSAYPWLVEPEQDCMVSPDSDGLLCGLLMTTAFAWRVRGFYDGKALVADHAVVPSQCVFLDMEVFRSEVRSIGHHMLLYNRNDVPPNWDQFRNALSVNNLRGHDGLHDFRLKYPFATVHFLLAVVAHARNVECPSSAVGPLLFTDGTYKNLFGYTENCLNWLQYLRADEPGSPLNAIFYEDSYTIARLMRGMNDFWRARDAISVRGQRGDRVAITTRGGRGEVVNLEPNGEYLAFDRAAKARAERFLKLLARQTGWAYLSDRWSWHGWVLREFTKQDLKSQKVSVTGKSFSAMVVRNPLSFAMTSGDNYEYTLEEPAKLT